MLMGIQLRQRLRLRSEIYIPWHRRPSSAGFHSSYSRLLSLPPFRQPLPSRWIQCAGKTTILKILGGKHLVDQKWFRVLGDQLFMTPLSTSGDLCYLGGEVLLLDEITVDLDVLARADLLRFLRKECEERGATIIYATHIFDGLEDWPSHIVYVAHGKLQLAMPMDEVKEISKLSLMRTVESWLRKERDEDRRKRKERKAAGLSEFEKQVDGSRVTGTQHVLRFE
ncbi:P-loop containing nucleoside triphosphate hydrolase [Sesbania bispinosa]|nr:P-loop containing nucleoside triphosphate hydrolase [Sesbania bispinosa]